MDRYIEVPVGIDEDGQIVEIQKMKLVQEEYSTSYFNGSKLIKEIVDMTYDVKTKKYTSAYVVYSKEKLYFEVGEEIFIETFNSMRTLKRDNIKELVEEVNKNFSYYKLKEMPEEYKNLIPQEDLKSLKPNDLCVVKFVEYIYVTESNKRGSYYMFYKIER